MLNFIYYPVSAILWFWHKVFGFVFSESSGASWVLAIVFLVFTLRALLYKPFVSQVRSMRKMAEMAPEMQKLKKKYGNDRQKMAAEMQKLQSANGGNPLGGCLPILVQIPVFIGLFHVLREFKPGKTENYVFGQSEVASYIEANVFGAKLGATIVPFGGGPSLAEYGTTVGQMLVVMIPLMIAAGIFTHITARHSVARQTAVQTASPQTAIMNRLMLYVFPVGVVAGAPFLPLAILFYWVSNNLWTLGQQHIVYTRIDREEADKKDKQAEESKARAPKPGQKPAQPAKAVHQVVDSNSADADDEEATGSKPGQKPVERRSARAGSGKGQANGTRPGGPNGASTRSGADEKNGAGTGRTAATGSNASGNSPDKSPEVTGGPVHKNADSKVQRSRGSRVQGGSSYSGGGRSTGPRKGRKKR